MATRDVELWISNRIADYDFKDDSEEEIIEAIGGKEKINKSLQKFLQKQGYDWVRYEYIYPLLDLKKEIESETSLEKLRKKEEKLKEYIGGNATSYIEKRKKEIIEKQTLNKKEIIERIKRARTKETLYKLADDYYEVLELTGETNISDKVANLINKRAKELNLGKIIL